jgi:hypothetical protein
MNNKAGYVNRQRAQKMASLLDNRLDDDMLSTSMFKPSQLPLPLLSHTPAYQKVSKM